MHMHGGEHDNIANDICNITLVTLHYIYNITNCDRYCQKGDLSVHVAFDGDLLLC